MDQIISAILIPLGVDYDTFVSKIKEDKIYSVLVDNKHIFSKPFVYKHLCDFIYSNFEGVLVYYKNQYNALCKSYNALNTLFILLVPSIHIRIYHSIIYETQPKIILKTALNIIGIKKSESEALIQTAKFNYDIGWDKW